MKISELTLDYVKKYLSVNHDLDDNRITSHIKTATSYIQASHGYKDVAEMELNEYLSDLAMIIIQDLYDNGTITQQNPISFLTIDRRFDDEV